ncbi:DUF6147 family protein [Faecalimonas sp.]
MKKKIVITAMALLFSFAVTSGTVGEVQAITTVPNMSVAEENTLSEGIIEPRGQYLQKGISSLGKIGKGKIKVTGTTIAQKTVAEIKVSVMVEREVKGDWVSYTSWSASDKNTHFLTTSKTLKVPRGYYYRVRSIHSANSDGGHSNTNAIYVD